MKKYLILFIVLISLILITWLIQPFLALEKIKSFSIKIIEQEERKISLPAPLKSLKENNNSTAFLTKQGIIKSTNDQRKNHGLILLKENETLNKMAEEKVNDMFKNQYFAHESLSGQKVGDLAEIFNYNFIAIGENLAMGNFLNDQDLVEAWMNSPGHRENILNKTYQEVGIAVKKSFFEGKTVWLAVQHFGLSKDVCPEPDKTIRLNIDQAVQEIEDFEELLSKNLTEIENIKLKRGNNYRQKVEQYNNLIEQYNNLLKENKKLVDQYNKQTQEYNECVSLFK